MTFVRSLVCLPGGGYANAVAIFQGSAKLAAELPRHVISNDPLLVVVVVGSYC